MKPSDAMPVSPERGRILHPSPWRCLEQISASGESSCVDVVLGSLATSTVEAFTSEVPVTIHRRLTRHQLVEILDGFEPSEYLWDPKQGTWTHWLDTPPFNGSYQPKLPFARSA